MNSSLLRGINFGDVEEFDQMVDDRFRAKGDAVVVLVVAGFAEGEVVDGKKYSCAAEESDCNGVLGFEVGDDTESVTFSVRVADFSKVAFVADAVDVNEWIGDGPAVEDCDFCVLNPADDEHSRGTQSSRSGKGTRR